VTDLRSYIIQYFFVNILRKVKLGMVLKKMAVSRFEYIYISEFYSRV